MNVRPASVAIPQEENSDTDSNPDEEYYQPISAFEEDGESEIGFSADGAQAENGISSIDINGGDSSEEEEVSDSEILRAFSEDESRRSAPLPGDTAMRVMEAMRGVSFAGTAPDWAGQVPEDQWIHQLRRMRDS